MIPFAALKLVPWRMVGYGIVALAVAGFVWRVTQWRAGYMERAAAVETLELERMGRAADRQAWEADRMASEAERQRFAADMTAIRSKYANLPKMAPKDLIAEVPRADSTCPDTRISDGFRVLWNAQAGP